MRTPMLLAILDGVGLAKASPSNAVSQADASFLHELFSDSTWPCRQLLASGRAVGLPEGQMGNSEVGHLNIGAGRVVNQELTRIDLAIEDNSLYSNPVLLRAMNQTVASGSRLHLLGLLSDGGVHSQISHLQALLKMAAKQGVIDIALHAFLDGRDVSYNSGQAYLQQTEAFILDLQTRYPDLRISIASVGGRYYAMDRDKRWDRVQRAWQAMVLPESDDVRLVLDKPASELVGQSYAEKIFDEFMVPVACDQRGVKDGDTLVFFNFRPDRARQLTRAFIDESFDGFEQAYRPAVNFICMTEYDPLFTTYGAEVAFAKEVPDNVLADYLSSLGLRQLHIAETEKYAHVTFFFNGGVEQPKPGEQRILIASPAVATYDLQPEMSAYQVTEELVGAIQSDLADVYILNYANGDMVGHTGIQVAAEAAITAVDHCLEQVVSAILAQGGAALITADHGNADQMLDEHGNVWTAHSLSPVPLVLISEEARIGSRTLDLNREVFASLADIAPTLLDLMGLAIPAEFTGHSLLVNLK